MQKITIKPDGFDDFSGWLGGFYVFVEAGKVDSAIDLLFEFVDDLCVDGRFEECDALIQSIDLSRLDTNLLVALLSITLAAKEQLQERALLVQKVERRLRELAPERLEGLMSGLR